MKTVIPTEAGIHVFYHIHKKLKVDPRVREDDRQKTVIPAEAGIHVFYHIHYKTESGSHAFARMTDRRRSFQQKQESMYFTTFITKLKVDPRVREDDRQMTVIPAEAGIHVLNHIRNKTESGSPHSRG